MKHDRDSTSTFTALRNRLYRKLWFAVLLSGTCISAHETAATWTMNSLGSSTFLLSLMSTVASLPIFLFTPPAGILADTINRRSLLCFINVWLAAAAGLLALLASFHLVNPFLILFCVFLLGIGFAFQAPAWSAMVPEVVANEELPSAAALGGLQLNVSGIIGPALGGVLLYFFGANWVFALNAFCFVVVICALLQWKGAKTESEAPLENFVESFANATRYVRYAPVIQLVLARNLLFAFFISVIPALMPVVGLKNLHLQPCTLGLLFTSMGAGSVLCALFILPYARQRLSSNTLTILANVLVAVVYLLMAFVQQPSIFMSVAALAGVGWTLGASELWVAGQRAIPGWARGRMSAIVIMVSQGAIALGAVLWGFCGQAAGVSVALVVAAIALSVSLILTTRLSIDCTTSLSFDPPPISCAMSPLVYNPQPRDGPVAITFEFEVERPRSREFLRLMRELRLIHLRNGAFGWRLDEELTRGNTYRVELTVPSWTGYLLQRQRLTKAEQEIIKKVWGLHVGEQIPLERYYLCVNRELLAQVRAEAEPSIMSASPLALGIPFKEFHEHRDE
jgi:MFS family permease